MFALWQQGYAEVINLSPDLKSILIAAVDKVQVHQCKCWSHFLKEVC